jgi:hypothetical protein
MTECDDLERRSRRLDAGQRLEFFCLKRALDGSQAIGPFGVTARGKVIETGGMGDQQRGHRVYIFAIGGLLDRGEIGTDHTRSSFDDGAFERPRLDREIFGEETRQRNPRACVGVEPQSGERLLGQ